MQTDLEIYNKMMDAIDEWLEEAANEYDDEDIIDEMILEAELGGTMPAYLVGLDMFALNGERLK